MKKRILILAVLLLMTAQAPAHAFVDTIVGGIRYASDAAYQAFMKIKILEEIQILKQNYDSSMRYYQQFKQLNSGRGLFYNVSTEIKHGMKQIEYEQEAAIDRDFIHTYRTDTKVDQFFQGIDRKIANNMKYAGDELANMIHSRDTGVQIAQNAQGLSPKDAANLSAKAQGLQLQILVQLHEDNVRLIELQTVKLADEMRRQESERRLINDIRSSVERRVPGSTGLGQRNDQGEGNAR